MANIKNLTGSKVGPGPSYHDARLAINLSSSGLQITRSLYFYSGSNYGGTRFTSNWYKRGTYVTLKADPSQFTLTTTVATLANLSYGTTYTFGGGSVTDADTSTVYRCAAGYYSGKHISSPTAYSYTPYKLTFNVNGGSWGANVRLNNSNYTGSNYVVVALNDTYFNDMSSDIPSRTGYTFKGWYTATSGGTQIYNASGARVTGTSYWNSSGQWIYRGNVTVYAQWEGVSHTNSLPVYAWSVSGGDSGSGSAWYLGNNTFTKKTGETFSLQKSSSTVTIPNGYALADTYGTSAVTGSWANYAFGTTITQTNANMSFEYDAYPVNYSITYNMNGGTNNSSNRTSYSVISGVTFADPPARSGYNFLGWYIDGVKVTGINIGASNVFSSAADMRTKLASRTTGNKTVEARWELAATASVYPDGSTRYPAMPYLPVNGEWKLLIGYKYDANTGTWKIGIV